jgi:hypothetical protein
MNNLSESRKKIKNTKFTISIYKENKYEEDNKSKEEYKFEIKFTEKEKENYKRQKNKCRFQNPIEEYKWAKTQKKICSKYSQEKNLCDFNGNTSGTDAFDKNGYRLRRPECKECTKNISKGKSEAKKKAKELGFSIVAPIGTSCAICNKLPSRGNDLVFDHCHVKNIFRGYCCNSCNRSIGVLGDNIDGLLRVINYLIKTDNCTIIQNEKGQLVKI